MKTISLTLLAILGFGFGIYAIKGSTGNAPTTQIGAKTEVDASPDQYKLLKEKAVGDMAGMRILEKPIDLSMISFTDGDGKPLKISDWKGRTVLLNLWATWCPPCRHEMPFLDDLQAQLGGDDFEVVAVTIDLKTPDKPKAFYAETNLKHMKFYWDGTAEIFNELKKLNLAFGMPTTVLIDKNGMARGVINGPAVWNSKGAIELVRQMPE